jgi:hypothetical protein
VDLAGEFHAIDRAAILPRPPACIPVWYAVATERAVERATRIADGALFPSAGEEVAILASKIRHTLERNGRNVDTFGLECIVDFEGGPKRWAAEVDRWRHIGGTHVCLRTCVVRAGARGKPREIKSITQHFQAMVQFMELFN